MEALNIIDDEKIEKSITEINTLIEKIVLNFNNMDRLINDTISTGEGIWDGEAASQFKTNWQETAKEIPLFVKMIESQVNNMSIIINKIDQANEE